MGNSESSSQLPAGTDGRRGVGRGNKSEEENDATSSTSIGTAVKVGAAVAGTALAAWGAWNMATSSSSEHPEDDRRRNALGAAQKRAVLEYDGAGRNSRGGRGLIPNEDYYYQPVNYHGSRTIKFMTYNVWKQEGTDCFGRELRERIQEIGRLVENHDPDLIFFQEVTPNIYQIFQSFDWWKNYVCSDSSQKAPEGDFCIVLSKLHLRIIRESYESWEGREFPTCKLDAGFGTSLLVANGHLICPNNLKQAKAPMDFLVNSSNAVFGHLICSNNPVKVNSEKRKKQAKAAMDFLDNSSNAVFGGDMNWNEDEDGSFPLPEGWVDAWTFLKGSDNGWTYDTQSNNNLKDRNTLQKRLDRFVCKLSNFELLDIKLIGKGPKPPSDHYGLLLTIRYK